MRLPAILLVFFALTPLLCAQTPAADAPPATPAQTAVHHDAPLNPALPTLFIVGDSTARNGADLGWGDHLAALFDTTKINVANRAVAGRSSRSYLDEGLWTKTLAEVKAGDTVLLQFGHNDGGDLGGAKPRGSLKGIGDETQAVAQTTGPFAGQTETIHTFGWYLRKYIADTRAKGATPILLTLTVRNIWKPGADGTPRIERDMGYNAFLFEVSEQQHVQVADMAELEAAYLQDLGQEKTAALFPVDHTHTSAAGAALNAGFVAQALRKIHASAAAFLLPDAGKESATLLCHDPSAN